MREQNAVIEQVAYDLEVPFVDLMGSLPVNADYWQQDGTHQSPEGSAAQARIYAEFLTENGMIPPPP